MTFRVVLYQILFLVSVVCLSLRIEFVDRNIGWGKWIAQGISTHDEWMVVIPLWYTLLVLAMLLFCEWAFITSCDRVSVICTYSHSWWQRVCGFMLIVFLLVPILLMSAGIPAVYMYQIAHLISELAG